ncbi:MAG: family N-acetyltransferase [Anaerosporomusa subterranea]|jgi:N-acetylglutamate synthase-like GNAT family acetyltransferase/SAM-dependent methyltransferase|nr:family N-acetyltransferase [Anaerosporomusa subterranea]
MNEEIREQVRQKYAQAIKSKSSCSSSTGCCGGRQEALNAITGNLYHADELVGLPEDMVSASFGCGNPTALGNLYAGETVLDLGSGAGIDVLLSANRVGPSGKVYGLDMTDEMLEEANANKQRSGLTNVEFLKGHIEDIPLPAASVDVVISNCVINLSTDKDLVFREIYRVLRPGGRVAVSDVVTTKTIPEKVRNSMLAWAGCLAGVLTRDEYAVKLSNAGFENVEVVVTRVYDLTGPGVREIVPGVTDEEFEQLNGSIISSFIRARKPTLRLNAGIDYTIRPAQAEDLPAIEKLLTASGLLAIEVAANLKNFLVADCAGVIGVIGSEYASQTVLLRSLAVDPTLRNAGVADALMTEAMKRAKTAMATKVYLFTNTASRYFANRGFQSIERDQVPSEFLNSRSVSTCCSSASTAMTLELE